MNELGDVVRLNSGRVYMYLGKYEDRHLYALVGINGQPISKSIAISNLYRVAGKRKEDYGMFLGKPNLSKNVLFNIDLSQHKPLLNSIWRLNRVDEQ